jgi:hypothetical protein
MSMTTRRSHGLCWRWLIIPINQSRMPVTNSGIGDRPMGFIHCIGVCTVVICGECIHRLHSSGGTFARGHRVVAVDFGEEPRRGKSTLRSL